MAARKHVAELVGLGIILSLVDTFNNDLIIEYINIFSSLCYS